MCLTRPHTSHQEFIILIYVDDVSNGKRNESICGFISIAGCSGVRRRLRISTYPRLFINQKQIVITYTNDRSYIKSSLEM